MFLPSKLTGQVFFGGYVYPHPNSKGYYGRDHSDMGVHVRGRCILEGDIIGHLEGVESSQFSQMPLHAMLSSRAT